VTKKSGEIMASVNHLILIGNVGRDPEVKAFPSGDQIANFSIATTETWKDKASGEKREATEWHRCVAGGGLAGIVGQYVKKGSQVYIEGSLKTRKWTDKDGAEKQTTEVRVHTLKMLGARPDGAGGGQQQRPAANQTQQRPAGGGGGFDDGEDIPF
jgi:single-strand DNA-binding protein